MSQWTEIPVDPFGRMLRAVAAEIHETAYLTGIRELHPDVERALREVPRGKFVPDAEVLLAYENTALPIGHGQTISQPFIVALMSELLRLGPDDRVLEIGTGSGYQAAVLSRLAAHVHSVEIVPNLAATAARRLQRLGYHNVTVATRDGYEGWPEHAPFDAIIVTAACAEVPPPLLDQLAIGGRMVLPLSGSSHTDLVLIEKRADGRTTQRSVLPVVFVPLTGSHGNAGSPR